MEGWRDEVPIEEGHVSDREEGGEPASGRQDADLQDPEERPEIKKKRGVYGFCQLGEEKKTFLLLFLAAVTSPRRHDLTPRRSIRFQQLRRLRKRHIPNQQMLNPLHQPL